MSAAASPTRITWLPHVLDHWEVKAIRRVFKILNGSTPKSGEPNYWDGSIAWATPDDLGDLHGDTLRSTRRTITEEGYRSCGTSLAPAGSLVLSTRAPIGHVAIAGIPLCTNQGCRTLVPRNAESERFLYYQIVAARPELESWGQGSTFTELSRDRLAAIYLAIPPSDDQRTIARFLDRETARIDALIEKKRRQIELLHEKRAALISHAVTKGIDPNAPMKDSGIEWLEKVPEHWEVWKVTHAFRQLGSGTTPKSDDLAFYGGDIPWVTTSELRETVITDTKNNLTPVALAQHSALRLYPEGTLLFAMYGATIGRMGILGMPSTVNQACAAFVGPRHLDTKFFCYWLQMRRPTLIALSVGGGQPNLSQDDLRQLRVPAPSLEEQFAIAAYLDRETGKIDALVDKVSMSIERLREYRTALISAAVTGKIDVRNLPAPQIGAARQAGEVA